MTLLVGLLKTKCHSIDVFLCNDNFLVKLKTKQTKKNYKKKKNTKKFTQTSGCTLHKDHALEMIRQAVKKGKL